MYFTRIALMLALSTTAMAQPPPRGGPPGPRLHEVLAERADEVGIDDATVAEIQGIFEANKDEAEALHEALKAEHDAMRELMDVERPKMRAVMVQMENVAAAELAMRQHQVGVELQVREFLTLEQWKALRPERKGPPGHRGPKPPR